MSIRKTIVELILANHPQDCLGCVRNTKCELQSLAERFGIRTSPFHSEAEDSRQPETESGVLVRDMRKCVKCGRCVEVCQEVQTVRAINSSHRSNHYEICTPYGRALGDGPCVFCGRCATVCPVGAIYEHDQTGEVWAALNDSACRAAVQISRPVGAALDGELGLSPGTVTSGRIVTALKQMGFDKVFDAGLFADMAINEEGSEVLARIKNGGKLPMIAGCSPGWINFVKAFYPDLADHLCTYRSPRKIFTAKIKNWYHNSGDASKIAAVSVTPCMAGKFETSQDADTALTARELARMIRIAGVDFNGLPESDFDSFTNDGTSSGAPGSLGAVLHVVHEAYSGESPAPGIFREAGQGIKEAEEEGVKALIASGLANARTVMDSIRKGECDAAFVGVKFCI
jgi:NADH-quinone oxidoreductase subunit G/NADP-reducing hydrogenase subunit HndD